MNSVRKELNDILEKALEVYCAKIGLDLRTKCRKGEYILARHSFVAAVTDSEERLTLAEVGNALNRDHATMIHSLKCVNRAWKYNDDTSVKMIKEYHSAKEITDKYFSDKELLSAEWFDMSMTKQLERNLKRKLVRRQNRIISLQKRLMLAKKAVIYRDKVIARLNKEAGEYVIPQMSTKKKPHKNGLVENFKGWY